MFVVCYFFIYNFGQKYKIHMKTAFTIKLFRSFNRSSAIDHMRITFPLIPKKVQSCLKILANVQSQKNKAVFISLNGIQQNPEHSQLLHDAIKHVNDNLRVPVYTFLEDRITALSYFVAAPSSHIAANPFCLMGDFTTPHKSYTNVKKLFEMFGVSFEMLGKQQPSIWQSWQQPNQQQKVLTKRWLQLIHNNLKICLKQRRNISDQNIQQFGSKLLTPKKALELKLIDEISTLTQYKEINFPNFKLRQEEISVKPRNSEFTQSQIQVLQQFKNLIVQPRTVMMSVDDPLSDCVRKLFEVISFRLSDHNKMQELDEILGKIFVMCQAQLQKTEIMI